jgi:hypothetical protein
MHLAVSVLLREEARCRSSKRSLGLIEEPRSRSSKLGATRKACQEVVLVSSRVSSRAKSEELPTRTRKRE